MTLFSLIILDLEFTLYIYGKTDWKYLSPQKLWRDQYYYGVEFILGRLGVVFGTFIERKRPRPRP